MYAPGFARKVPAGSSLVFQMHYTPNGTALKDTTTVGLIYAKAPVKYAVVTRPVLEARFVIPAGDPNYEVKSSVHVQRAGPPLQLYAAHASAWERFCVSGSFPRWHHRRYCFQCRVTTSVGKPYYVAKEPIAVPKGTRIECVAHFDNSTNNKYNPDPTQGRCAGATRPGKR